MSERKGLWVLLTFSLALNFAFVAVWVYHYFFVRPALQAQTDGGLQRFEALSLTDEQRGQILAAQQVLRQSIQEARGRSAEAREKLADLMAAPESDPETLRVIRRDIDDSEGEVHQLVVQHLLHVRSTLTPEQREQFGHILRERMRGGPPTQRGMSRRQGRQGPREHPGAPLRGEPDRGPEPRDRRERPDTMDREPMEESM